MIYAEESVLPDLAPLSEAMINHWSAKYQEQHPKSPDLSVWLRDRVSAVEQQFDQEWKPLVAFMDDPAALEVVRKAKLQSITHSFRQEWAPVIAEVEEIREKAYTLLSPVVARKEQLTSEWVAVTLAHHAPHPRSRSTRKEAHQLAPQTLSRWRSQGLLYGWRNRPAFHAVWALLMMRLREQVDTIGFLPPGDYTHNPIMYCYRQDTPTSPVVTCGLPLDRNPEPIPNHAFLFSRLSNLGLLDRDWKPFQGWSVRWAGATEDEGMYLWNLTEKEIAIWNEDVRPPRVLDSVAHLVRSDLANMVLLHVASERLGSPPSALSALIQEEQQQSPLVL